MRTTSGLVLLAALLAACKPVPGDDTTGTTTGESTTGEFTTSSTSGSPLPTTSTTSAEASASATGEPASTTAAEPCDASTCNAALCDLAACVCAVTPADPAIDCGFVGPDDPPAAWVLAQDCVLDAVAARASFILVVQGQGIDSLVADVYRGVAGTPYSLQKMDYDSYNPDALLADCSDIVATDDCLPATLSICLECVEPGEKTQLCV